MEIDFEKYSDGLVPAIIQDPVTRSVLMLGYMNQEALDMTINTGKVTFFSRSRQRLWTKGEESGHFLLFKEVRSDCDNDSLLVSATPVGPTCHKGTDTCWNQKNIPGYGFLDQLEEVIKSRKQDPDNQSSYVASLFKAGINKIAQKVGEEAVETVIEAKDTDEDKAF